MAFAMNLRLFIVVMALMVFVTACEETYIGDVEHPLIPAYTEEGNNDAGAFINGLPWRASPEWKPNNSSTNAQLRYVDSTQTTGIGLPSGYIVTGEDIPSQEYSLSFSIYFDLMEWYAQNRTLPIVIPLDGSSGHARISGLNYTSGTSCRSNKGMLYIRYIGTNDRNDLIIAGTFGFELEDDCGVYRVTSGRFDFVFDRLFF